MVTDTYLEAVASLATGNVYQAHCVMDHLFADYPRDGQRFWQVGLLPLEQERTLAVLRMDGAIKHEEAATRYRMAERAVPDEIEGAALFVPKQTKDWSPFRDEAQAVAQVLRRLALSGETASVALSPVETLRLQRKNKPIVAPVRAVYFRLRADAQKRKELLLRGLGGLRGLGMGLVLTDPAMVRLLEARYGRQAAAEIAGTSK